MAYTCNHLDISYHPKNKNYKFYCKYQLIKYKTWIDNTYYLWDEDKLADEDYILVYNKFLKTDLFGYGTIKLRRLRLTCTGFF